MNEWKKAYKICRREIRNGTKGFRIFMACLILGVTTIAAVGSLYHSISNGLERDGRAILGGDLDIRVSSQGISTDQLEVLKQDATISQITKTRAMSRFGEKRQLVELKAVDHAYPLAGEVVVEPAQNLQNALAGNGVVVEQTILTKLDAKIGDTLQIGDTEVVVKGIIKKEPDRIVSVINFGPHILLSYDTFAKTNLIQPGSIYHHHYRLNLNKATDLEQFKTQLEERFPDVGWRIRTPDKAAPGIENFIDRLSLFLNFVGFTTLLIGGVGVSAGVRDFINTKTPTIATLKCLGASGDLIFKTYFLQILFLTLISTSIGMFLGALLPYLFSLIGSAFLPVEPEAKIYIFPLLYAAAYGFLTVLTFALWPLGKAQNVAAGALFRDKITPIDAPPLRKYKVASLLSLLILIALTLLTSIRMDFAAIFIVASAAILFVLLKASHGISKIAEKIPPIASTHLRLAIKALHKPGNSVTSVVVSLGLGLSVLVAVTQIDQNMRGQIQENIPKEAPTFFFIDVQNHQVADFDRTLQTLEGTKNYKRVPSLRGRIVEINGVDVQKIDIPPQSQWAIRGDRALTYSNDIPEDTIITEGEWWSVDYKGPPLISFDSGLAQDFGVGVGDTLTLNILGRNITAKIASLRAINWRSIKFDFAIILSPGLLENAPHTHIGAINTDTASENAVEKTLARDFPNVSVIRVKEALEAANDILNNISNAVGLAASLTVLAGALVLGGALSSGRDQRIYEAVIYKVIGVTRFKMLQSYLIEYGVLGLVTGFISAIVGTIASWAVIRFLMDMDWQIYPLHILMTLVLCLFLTIAAGFIGTWSALGQKAAPHLRNE